MRKHFRGTPAAPAESNGGRVTPNIERTTHVSGRLAILAIGFLLVGASAANAQSLKGSRASLDRQNRQARSHDYSYLRSSTEARRFRDLGLLVRLSANADYELAAVSFPYARPAVRTFVERLAQQYRAACGERLVVTSLTRPASRQPRNASDRSVHPTGMALDIRRSKRASCRSWLEKTLLELEGKRAIEATRELRPPHYHVAVFPQPYERYVAALDARAPETAYAYAPAGPTRYRVKRGDSLWGIARRHGTTVGELKAANGLRSSRILAGQVLSIPGEAR